MYRNTTVGPKRGVALYSYSAEFGFEKTLEDCFEDLKDMGATGVEILANTHIENYPYPTDEWVNYWFSLCDKYQVEPVEYGHWIDCSAQKKPSPVWSRICAWPIAWASRCCAPR